MTAGGGGGGPETAAVGLALSYIIIVGDNVSIIYACRIPE